MASTFTPILRAELISTGDQTGTWGTTTDSNILNVFEAAIAGAANITVTSVDYTLSQANNAPDEARNAVIRTSGALTGNRAVIVPSVSKPYLVYNGNSGGFTLTVKTAAGTGVVIPQGSYLPVYCDGTNVVAGVPTASATFTGTVTAASFAGPLTGNVTGNVTGSAGSSGIPQDAQTGATYTCVLGDANSHIYHGSGGSSTFTIPANSSVAYPLGTTLTFVNMSGTMTIAITTDTMTFAQVGTTGSRTLAVSGIATALKITSTSWLISGAGLT